MGEVLEAVTKIAVVVFVVTGMAETGLATTARDVVGPLRRGRTVALALAVNFVVAPALAYGISVMLPMHRPYAIGLLLAGCAAGAPFMPKLTNLARGDAAFSVALMLMLMVGSVVFMPVVLPLMI